MDAPVIRLAAVDVVHDLGPAPEPRRVYRPVFLFLAPVAESLGLDPHDQIGRKDRRDQRRTWNMHDAETELDQRQPVDELRKSSAGRVELTGRSRRQVCRFSPGLRVARTCGSTLTAPFARPRSWRRKSRRGLPASSRQIPLRVRAPVYNSRPENVGLHTRDLFAILDLAPAADRSRADSNQARERTRGEIQAFGCHCRSWDGRAFRRHHAAQGRLRCPSL